MRAFHFTRIKKKKKKCIRSLQQTHAAAAVGIVQTSVKTSSLKK